MTTKTLFISFFILKSLSSYGIMNGQEADSYTRGRASVVGLYDHKKKSQFCTGTLISNNVILTAAHCVTEKTGQDMKISFIGGVQRGVSKIHIHPNFRMKKGKSGISNFPYQYADLALISIKGQKPAQAKVAAISSSLKEFRRVNGITFGYGLHNGLSNTLDELTVLNYGEFLARTFVNDQILISGKKKQAICYGDSGGPTFVDKEQESRPLLLGVTSALFAPRSLIQRGADRVCKQRDKTLIINVAKHLSWIREGVRQGKGKTVNQLMIDKCVSHYLDKHHDNSKLYSPQDAGILKKDSGIVRDKRIEFVLETDHLYDMIEVKIVTDLKCNLMENPRIL